MFIPSDFEFCSMAKERKERNLRLPRNKPSRKDFKNASAFCVILPGKSAFVVEIVGFRVSFLVEVFPTSSSEWLQSCGNVYCCWEVVILLAKLFDVLPGSLLSRTSLTIS